MNGSFGFGAFAIKVSSVDEKYQSTPFNAQSLNWFHARVGKRQKQGKSCLSVAGMASFRHAARQMRACYADSEDFAVMNSTAQIVPNPHDALAGAQFADSYVLVTEGLSLTALGAAERALGRTPRWVGRLVALPTLPSGHSG
ncbi:hypothetical protein [Mesorhizobium sp. Root695]|uniref:hypothetical protein n=1 Tax=unclassified Mesorhizobium TaxID=325217 RepID=UPI002A4E2A5B|nr:hypothetical protein [Mesorhizobium sp. Root695]